MTSSRLKTSCRNSLIHNTLALGANGRNLMELACLRTRESTLSSINIYDGHITQHDSYTYEVCLFGEARQKPMNGGTTFSLGYVLLIFPKQYWHKRHNRRFTSWNPMASPGELPYYHKQVYKHGARCWNGPERSVIVRLGLLSLSIRLPNCF